MPKIFVIPELCSGCRLCEMFCSFLRVKRFNPRESLIKIFKVEDDGTNIPLIGCDGKCPTPEGAPKCVSMCPTGALVYVTLSEAVRMRRELAIKRKKQPIFRVIAPWKYPFQEREWPFEEGAKS
jgi:Fe-S-cluster-containing hydrogenase component 2